MRTPEPHILRALRRRRTLGPALLGAAALPLAACGAADRPEAEVVEPPAVTAPATPTPSAMPSGDRDARERGRDLGRDAERCGRETGELWKQYGGSRRR